MATVTHGEWFEWDSAKAASNLHKHGVSFVEASTAFADESALVVDDGGGHGTVVLVGYSTSKRLLVVVHVDRMASRRVRIISARRADRAERRRYEEG